MYNLRIVSSILTKCIQPRLTDSLKTLLNSHLAIKQISSISNENIAKTLCKSDNVASLSFTRHYAKGKDKKKDKGTKTKVEVNENQISELVNLDALKTHLQKPIEQLKEDFTKHLSVRSSAGSIESISVNLDGKEHTLQELAQIVRKNPKTVVVNMGVFPQAIPAVLKAIEKSGMNLNPQQDGTTLFIPIPKITKEHREGLSKNAKMLFVKCKDSIRDVQNKNLKQIKRKDKVSEDLVRSVEQQIAVIANGYIAEAEKILESKQKELVG